MKPVHLAALCLGLVIGVALGAFMLLRLFNGGERMAFVSNRQGGHESQQRPAAAGTRNGPDARA